jgi:hypothetical protein
MLLVERTFGENYRFGFNTQEQDDEIYGDGNMNTALFWEYETRLGRRWNLDPKPNFTISLYCAFINNPILFTDIAGDTAKASQEGYLLLQEGLTATLGADNPFGYNSDKGYITINENIDRSKYNDEQLRIIDQVGAVVTSTLVNELIVVNFEEPILELGNKSLADYEFNGATARDGSKTWIARNPQQVGEVPNPKYNPYNIYSEQYIAGWVNAGSYSRGLNTLHEIGGHAYLRFEKPNITQAEHNQIVENFETSIRQIYQIGVYETKKEVRKANKKGLNVKIGDPIYLKGAGQKHGEFLIIYKK